MFERAKTVQALHRAATVIGVLYFRLINNELENLRKEAIVTQSKSSTNGAFFHRDPVRSMAPTALRQAF
jgi:hypothetical protein